MKKYEEIRNTHPYDVPGYLMSVENLNLDVVSAIMRSIELKQEYIDFSDSIRDAEIAVSQMKEMGVTKFTVSSSWSGEIGRMYELVQHGCKVIGMTMVNRMRNWDRHGEKYVRVPAMMFEIVC